jgi:hypothetical protein
MVSRDVNIGVRTGAAGTAYVLYAYSKERSRLDEVMMSEIYRFRINGLA